MDIINSFQEVFGSRWNTVKFFFNDVAGRGNCFPKETRFCEAMSRAWFSDNVFTRDCASCAGANYVFGWDDHVEDSLIENLHHKKKIPRKEAASIVKGLPRMRIAPSAIGLNNSEEPDLLVAYLQPGQLMNLLSMYQKIFREELRVDLSSYTSVCGKIAVNTYLSGKISLSFGCEDSRQHGDISRDKLIVGIPYPLAKKMI